MRAISFFLTTDQIRARDKDVTRRLGWSDVRPGTLLRAVVKAQGLKRGERQESLGVIRVLDARRERLDVMLLRPGYGRQEVVREGFPELTASEFVAMFCRSHRGCTPQTDVTRIEFEYVDEVPA